MPRTKGILEAVTCYCQPGACDCNDARVRAAELQATFNLRWKADMRAIKRWQEAHPGSELIWPDHADLVIWLAEQNAALSAALATAKEAGNA